MARTVENWLDIMQTQCKDDLHLSRFALLDLTGYRTGNKWEDEDIKNLLALFAAIRIHQTTKES